MHLKKISLLASLLVGSMAINISKASAYPVQNLTVGGNTYTVTYDLLNISELSNPNSVLSTQPWAHSVTEAFAFARALGGCNAFGTNCTAYPNQAPPVTNRLGFPNTFIPGQFESPIFAFSDRNDDSINDGTALICTNASGPCSAFQGVVDTTVNSGIRYFARVQYLSTPEPLDFLGALTGLAFLGMTSRALKKKVS